MAYFPERTIDFVQRDCNRHATGSRHTKGHCVSLVGVNLFLYLLCEKLVRKTRKACYLDKRKVNLRSQDYSVVDNSSE